MGSVLQRKKRKSNRPKVVRKPKSKKRILNNPIIAANWNAKETVSQNYNRLGLTAKLNKTAGGVEKKTTVGLPSFIINPTQTPIESALAEVSVRLDPATGRIVELLSQEVVNPLNDPLVGTDAMVDVDGGDGVVITQHNFYRSQPTAPAGTVVAQLEQAAAVEGGKKIRHQSKQEQEWCASLVAKHGSDYAAMVRDRKLNPMQQSMGDIRRRITRWNSQS